MVSCDLRRVHVSSPRPGSSRVSFHCVTGADAGDPAPQQQSSRWPKTLFVGANTGSIYVWSVSADACASLLRILPVKGLPSATAALSLLRSCPRSDGTKVAVVVEGRSLYVVDLRSDPTTALVICSICEQAPAHITALVWSPKGDVLFYGDTAGHVCGYSLLESSPAGNSTRAQRILDAFTGAAVIQLEHASGSPTLLVSTMTRSLLLNYLEGGISQVGTKLRQGAYGACFGDAPSTHGTTAGHPPMEQDDLPIFAARPGRRVWQARGTTVLQTLKPAWPDSTSTVVKGGRGLDADFITLGEAAAATSAQLGRLFHGPDRFLLSVGELSVAVLDPVGNHVVEWWSGIPIADVLVSEDCVFILGVSGTQPDEHSDQVLGSLHIYRLAIETHPHAQEDEASIDIHEAGATATPDARSSSVSVNPDDLLYPAAVELPPDAAHPGDDASTPRAYLLHSTSLRRSKRRARVADIGPPRPVRLDSGPDTENETIDIKEALRHSFSELTVGNTSGSPDGKGARHDTQGSLVAMGVHDLPANVSVDPKLDQAAAEDECTDHPSCAEVNEEHSGIANDGSEAPHQTTAGHLEPVIDELIETKDRHEPHQELEVSPDKGTGEIDEASTHNEATSHCLPHDPNNDNPAANIHGDQEEVCASDSTGDQEACENTGPSVFSFEKRVRDALVQVDRKDSVNDLLRILQSLHSGSSSAYLHSWIRALEISLEVPSGDGVASLGTVETIRKRSNTVVGMGIELLGARQTLDILHGAAGSLDTHEAWERTIFLDSAYPEDASIGTTPATSTTGRCEPLVQEWCDQLLQARRREMTSQGRDRTA